MAYSHRYSGVSNPATPNLSKTTEWRGTVDGNFQTAGNWTNGAPITGDTLIWNSGSVNVDAGLSNGSLEGLLLYFHKDWGGKIDGALVIGSAEKVKIRKRTGAITITGGMEKVHILDTDGGDAAVTLGTTSPDEIGELHLHGTAGEVIVSASSVLNKVYAFPHKGMSATLTLGASITNSIGGTGINLIEQGTRSFLTASTGSVTWEAYGACVATLSDPGASGTLTAGSGAIVDHRTSGTTTRIDVQEGGSLDMSKSEVSATVITDMGTHPSSKVRLDTGLRSVTITNGIEYYGGEIVPDQGQTVAVT